MPQSIKINFYGDENVSSHIINNADSTKKTRQKDTTVGELAKPFVSPKKKEVYDEESDTCRSKLSNLSLLVDETESSQTGSDLFRFQSPKSYKTMLMKAFDSASKTHGTPSSKPATPKSKSGTPKSQSGTPKSSKVLTPKSSSKVGGKSVSTPKGKASKAASRDTPRKLNLRNRRVDSDESSDDENDETESSDEDPEPVTLAKAQKDHINFLKEAVEDYFMEHSGSAGGNKGFVKTSDRTLAKLGSTRPDPVTIKALLDKRQQPYRSEVEKIKKLLIASFPRWKIELSEGFNLVLYGLGSKRELIKEFQKRQLSHHDCLVVPGYQPNITLRQLLQSICGSFLHCTETHKSFQEQAKFIKQHFDSESSSDLYLLIHNIDGAQFRGEKSQSALSILADAKHIHILASVDHINAAMMWSHSQSSRFNWVWHDTTTLSSYSSETFHENSLMVSQSGAMALTSLRHVMASLTQNARDIFLMMVRHQLEGSGDPGYQGISLDDLYWRCRDALLVNSDVTLRAQLTEFKDHQLLKFKKGLDGTELIIILLDEANMIEFIQNFDDYQ